MRNNSKPHISDLKDNFKTILENINDVVFQLTPKGIIKYVSPRVKDVYGYDPDDLIGKRFDVTTPPEDVIKAKEALKNVLMGIEIKNFDIKQYDQNGNIIHMSINFTPIIDNDKVVAVQGIMRDVTAHRHADEELMKFKAIADNANYGVAISDLKGKLTYINEYFANLHGYRASELIGKNISIFHSKKQLSYVNKINKRIKEEGNISTVEVWHTRKNGYEFPMLMNGITIKDNEGRPQFMAATAIDITERKFAEEQILKSNQELKRLNKTRADFTSMISHEMRSPLSSIKAGVSIILEELDGPLNRSQKETLNIAEKNINRLSNLINNILDLTKFEAGMMNLDLKNNDINELANNVYLLMRPLADRKTIEFILDTPTKTISAMCDAERLKQVMGNLIDNAIKFTNKEGKIRLAISQSQDWIVLEVEDNGLGIKDVEKDLIFEKFRQGSHKELISVTGSGLGLAICKQIVEEHKGNISVQSRFGKGSKFTVKIPASNQCHTS
ncbi:MAG: PAS domain-containing sensor histidine kinase [Pseudomonadota bacterium]